MAHTKGKKMKKPKTTAELWHSIRKPMPPYTKADRDRTKYRRVDHKRRKDDE
jgi:hypothetical protein